MHYGHGDLMNINSHIKMPQIYLLTQISFFLFKKKILKWLDWRT